MSYKCTDFCDDEVLFSGIAHGGRTELCPDNAPSALMSVTVAEELGIFGVKPSKAMDMLTGKRVSLGLSIEAYDREVQKKQKYNRRCWFLFLGLRVAGASMFGVELFSAFFGAFEVPFFFFVCCGHANG